MRRRGCPFSELQLRTRTGASIVGIERDGANIINPNRDEEPYSADRILLLGPGLNSMRQRQLWSLNHRDTNLKDLELRGHNGSSNRYIDVFLEALMTLVKKITWHHSRSGLTISVL
jgi:hypothetical protein